MQLGKTIRLFREEQGLSRSKLARMADISNNYMMLVENEDNRADNIGHATLRKIANALGISLIDIFNKTEELSETTWAEIQEKKIPVIGTVNDKNAQITLNHENKLVRVIADTIDAIKQLNDPQAYALKIADNSMEPIGKDCLLIISPVLEVKNHDLVIFWHDDKLWFRRVQINNNFCVFHTIIQTESTIIIPTTELKMMDKVWGFIRD